MEEANLNILYAVGFQLHDILEKAKLWRQENDEWLPGIQGRREGGPGRTQRIFRAVNLLCMNKKG